MDFVSQIKSQCSLSEMVLLKLIGLARRKFFDWKKSYGRAWKVGFNLPRAHCVQEWEKDAVVDFYTKHELDGYRRCAYMMMDEDLVYIAPSTVYYILKSYGVMRSRNVKKVKKVLALSNLLRLMNTGILISLMSLSVILCIF